MNCKRIDLPRQNGFLELYLPSNSHKLDTNYRRPMVLICPGGGYVYTSDREADPIALSFCTRGFAACVLRYPVKPARYPASLLSAAYAVAWLRRNAEDCEIDPNRIFICGFSAGGHLAASLGVFWNSPELQAATGLSAEEMRPNKQVLCYPVITSGPFAHRASFDNLLIGREDADTLREKLSLENQVSADTPPTFLWHTYTDPAVPVENTLLFANALRRAEVPFELHIYSVGNHGLSLATEETGSPQPECTGWLQLAADWMLRDQ